MITYKDILKDTDPKVREKSRNVKLPLSDEDRNELSEMINEVRKRMTEMDDKCKKWEEEYKNFPIS